MTTSVGDLLAYGVAFYNDNNIDNAEFEVSQLLAFCLQLERLREQDLQNEVSADCAAELKNCLQQRKNGDPLQYIIGEWDFYGRTFVVDRGVLIPRPETEELTDRALSFINSNSCRVVYDICAGTGCIGLTVALECPWIHVYLFELYDAPLQCIEKNISRYDLKNVTLVKADVLHADNILNLPPADVIISNPPYIPSAELIDLQAEVLKEPITALDGGDDGMCFYNVLADHWYAFLQDGGRMFLECAEDQADRIQTLFPVTAFEPDDCGGFSDFYGLPRFVIAAK